MYHNCFETLFMLLIILLSKMFESDDFDQILSQFDLPDTCSNTPTVVAETQCPFKYELTNDTNNYSQNKSMPMMPEDVKENTVANTTTKTCNKIIHHVMESKPTSPKHSKRKLINSYFDHKSKRKFPGPAGLLNGTFEDSKEVDNICHVELLSQDIDYSENYLRKGIFESPLWARLLVDTRDINKVDSIKNIKQQALEGNLRHQKAEMITAYVERIERSAKDPLIVLRDMTDDIKCTLHRDAWVAFSPYIISEFCGLILCSPTVLTTGSAFKKHYLNITLRNIQAVYSSAIIKQEEESFPSGFVKTYEEDYTIIRNRKQNIGNINFASEFEDSNLLDGLDGAFSDDIFS